MKNELLNLAGEAEKLFDKISKGYALPDVDLKEINRFLSDRFSFSKPRPVSEITEDINTMLSLWTLQTNHPRHFGLYQPSLKSMGVIADALAAAYNPQLGAWWFSPAANEIEKHCLAFISRKFGFVPKEVFSCFTSGGSESTTSAVLCALTKRFPDYGQVGAVGLTRRPKIYVSAEAHDSILKIAHQTGLGRSAVKRIPTDSNRRLDVDMLVKQISADRKESDEPFLVVATAGTTAVGAIDPISEIAAFCKTEHLWLHVDAAWGGGFIFSNETCKHLKGIEGVDSITWDPHKSLPIPTGAGYFLCRYEDAVDKAFNVSTSYVPDEVEGQLDLYKAGLQWSRRFIGLKVFMIIAELGEEGLARMVEHQFAMGRYLLRRLKETGWIVESNSPLPVVCFSPPNAKYSIGEILNSVLHRRKCWISQIKLDDKRNALRACITSYKTEREDIDILIDELNMAII